MKHLSIGNKLFFSVVAVFIVFAVTLILVEGNHKIWVAVATLIIFSFPLYRYTHRLDQNINNLRQFAKRADDNEDINTDELIVFPNDELGDIAERIIKMYRRLETTRQEQTQMKRELTQNVAHELKTPAAGIQGYLETILQNRNIDDATRWQFLERCYVQCERLTSLLQDISTLDKMDNSLPMQNFEPVDIAEMVRQIQMDTDLQLRERDMSFHNQLPVSVIVSGNPKLLYSIFRNLTDNAIAHAGQGTTITLSAKEQAGEWLFTFSDNGAGIPNAHLPRLFERFYRIDKGRSRKLGGTGLGLAIVKNAVLQHNGTISVSNAPEGGLQFIFTIHK